MLMTIGGNPLTLGSKGTGGLASLCRPLAHGLGFFDALMLALGTPYRALNLSDLLGAKRCTFLCACGVVPRP